MPHLKELVQLLDPERFVLVGVNVGDEEAAFRAGRSKFGVDWPVAYSADDVAKLYRVQAFPTIFVLDGEGRIRATNLRGDRLSAFVRDLVGASEER